MALNTDVTWANRVAKAILLIRVLVGWVFLSEGIQKFLFPDSLGVGRFVKIGIPWPQVMAPFVGVVEIVCGTLLLIGFLTRLATVPLLIDICSGLVLDEDRYVCQERVLGHSARGPHRCEHAAWFDLSVACWWRITRSRCLACFQKA